MTEIFAADWLALREPADIAARSVALADAFFDSLPPRPRILDLGAGTGSNARFLSARAASRGQEADWLLVDGDPLLLDCVTGLPGFDRQVIDFADDPGKIDFTGIDGVCASALFDLVSERWFSQFVAMLDGRPFLAALTAEGGHRWHPEDPADMAVDGWFGIDMRRDKGFGPAMGLNATAGMTSCLKDAGYAVQDAETPWRLGSHDAALVAAMIDGVADAAQRHGDPSKVGEWRQRRHTVGKTHGLHLTVGHRDLLAVRTEIGG